MHTHTRMHARIHTDMVFRLGGATHTRTQRYGCSGWVGPHTCTHTDMGVQAGGDHTHAHTLTTHAHAHTHTWIAPCHLPDWDALLNFCRMLPLGETGKRVEGPGVFLTTTCKPTILLMKKLGMWESKFFIPFSLGQGLYLLLFIQQVLSLSHSFTHTHTHTHTHTTHTKKLRSMK